MNKKLIAVYGSDLHLSPLVWNRLPTMTGDALFGLQCLLHLANTNNVPLLLGGDIWDSVRITPEFFLKVRSLFERYNVKTYYINGNHDPATPSWTDALPDTHILGRQPINIGGLNICGINYVYPDDFAEEVSRVYPGSDVLIIHQTLGCFSNNAPWAVPHALVKQFPLVLAGDYHKAMAIRENNNVLISAGSTHPRTIRELTGLAILLYDDSSFDIKLYPSRTTIRITDTVPNKETFNSTKAEVIGTQEGHLEDWGLTFPEELQSPLVIIEAQTDNTTRSVWKEFAPDCHILLVDTSAKTDTNTESVDSEIPTRGSKAYILDCLSGYPASDQSKTIVASLLTNSQEFLSNELDYLTLQKD